MTTEKENGEGKAPPPARTFEEAVRAVVNAPPTPEQQAKKDASKARQAERKSHQHPSGDKDAPTKQ